MNSKIFETTLSRLLLAGPTFISLFLIINSVTDPVNAPKMAVLGGVGFAFGALLVNSTLRRTWIESRYLVLALSLFVFAMFNAVLNSKTPITQNLYGVYGRNTGLITYISLVLVLLGVIQVRKIESLKAVIRGFLFVGVINLVYCAWVLAFGDFIPWNNPYKKILGLFGNPDFISAFLGIFISCLYALALAPNCRTWKRVVAIFVSGVAFFEILQSHAIQGIAVTVFGIGIVTFFAIKAKSKSSAIPLAYLLVAFISGVMGILGTLQIGPLSFIYKKSVSLRGAYWQAGINMGQANPLTGVGMDSYGESYRAARPAVALIDTPGPNVVTNAAHNVFLDFFSYGGWPLLTSYCLVLLITFLSVFRVTIRHKHYEPVFVALTVIWATYLIQSIISINQIGLVIWGWVASGGLIAYEIFTRESGLDSKKITGRNTPRANREEFITPNLVASIGFVIGLIIAVPSMSADLKWKSAIDSRNIANVERALEPGYFNPSSSFRYANAVILLSQNGFDDVALKYARIAVEFNPEYSDAWRQLYSLPQSTDKEKVVALTNLKRLDPNNPDPLGLKP